MMPIMRRLLSALVLLAWGLWLGGLMTLVLAVATLFQNPDLQGRAPLSAGAPGPGGILAGSAAAGVFHVFERYQLGLAAAALLFTCLWRLMGGAPRLKTTLFALFALCALSAAGLTLHVTPQIEQHRLQGTVTGAEFDRLHHTATAMYEGQAIVLLLGGFLLPSILARDAGAKSTKDTNGHEEE
jgi:hypothetical protein